MTGEAKTATVLDAPFLQTVDVDITAPDDVIRELLSNTASTELDANAKALIETSEARRLLHILQNGSPYLFGLVRRDLARWARVLGSDPAIRLKTMLEDLEVFERTTRPDKIGFAELSERARQVKTEGALLIAIADIVGLWSLEHVTEALTAIADTSLTVGVRHLFRQAVASGTWRLGEGADPARPEVGSGYFVLAMGKHGGRELNYSSDIDLIIFYERDLVRLADPSATQRFYVRLTQDLVRFMAERTPHGYVFRTDLRLRPDPGATQVAMSTDSAFHYYEGFGQNWERAAFIKARPVAGDIQAGETFLKDLSPFIWRKYLDYAAIADIHAMKRQIHAHKGFAEIAVAGHNIKVGRGGIREIEFFAQTQQLIAGGRQPELRTSRTKAALEILAQRGWVTPKAAAELSESYNYLRRLEHRLQMMADEQTQRMPREDGELYRLAVFAGYADTEELSQDLTSHLQIVQRHYAGLFEESRGLSSDQSNLVLAGEDSDPETEAVLAEMGYKDAEKAIAIVRAWHRGRYRAMASTVARERLTELQPTLLNALAGTVDPDAALLGFDKLLSQLPAGVQLFSLLHANPKLLDLIASITGSAPRLARILARRRRVIDAVLDPLVLGNALPTRADLEGYIQHELSRAERYEQVLDTARVIAAEQSFLIGIRVLGQTAEAREAGEAYADLAEVLIGNLQDHVEREFVSQHGTIASGAWCIVAMGKLGGREMTAASDLDLIIIYDANESAKQSNGDRFLPLSQYYARQTQRLIAALSAPTAEGRLFDVDLRLRPSGQKGPVATRLTSFQSYQLNEAWTWEHMALTRARVVSGPQQLKDRVQREIREILCEPRDAAVVLKAVREMRDLIQREKGTDDIWDLKHVRGGLVDVEFIAQAMQLIHASQIPEVLVQKTRDALSALDAHALLGSHGETLIAASDLYNEITQVLRLCFDGRFEPRAAPDGLKYLLADAANLPTFAVLEAELTATQARVRSIFDEFFPRPDDS